MKHEGHVLGAVFTGDDNRILSWSQDGTVRLWDAHTQTQLGLDMKHQVQVVGRPVFHWRTRA